MHSVRNAAGTAVRFTKPRGIRELAFALPEPKHWSAPSSARAAIEGAFVGDFDPDTYRSDRKDQSVQSFTLVAPAGADRAAVEAAFAEGVIIGESQNFTRSLVNEPGNKLTPTILGQRAAAMANEVGLDLRSPLDRKAARAEDGRLLERLAGLGGAARADRSSL